MASRNTAAGAGLKDLWIAVLYPGAIRALTGMPGGTELKPSGPGTTCAGATNFQSPRLVILKPRARNDTASCNIAAGAGLKDLWIAVLYPGAIRALTGMPGGTELKPSGPGTTCAGATNSQSLRLVILKPHTRNGMASRNTAAGAGLKNRWISALYPDALRALSRMRGKPTATSSLRKMPVSLEAPLQTSSTEKNCRMAPESWL